MVILLKRLLDYTPRHAPFFYPPASTNIPPLMQQQNDSGVNAINKSDPVNSIEDFHHC